MGNLRSSGQPLYLGADEINEIYLGSHQITEAYLGTDLVYSSGPFVGLKVTPNAVSFSSIKLTNALKVKCSEQWTMTLPDWITANTLTGDTGETTVLLVATTQQAATSSTITIASANFSTGVTAEWANVEQLKCIYNAGMVEMGFNTSEKLVWTFNGQIINYDGGVLLGVYGLPDSDDYRFFKSSASFNFFDIGSRRLTGNWGIALNTDVEIEGGNCFIKVDGTQKSSALAVSSVPVGAFAVNTDKIKMYSLAAKLVDDATLQIADIVPIKVGNELYFWNRRNNATVPVTSPNAQYETL